MENLRLEKDMEKVMNGEKTTQAKGKVLRAYMETKELGTENLTITDFFWEKEQEEALNYLREAGIEKITIEDQSTGLMDNLHYLLSNGCQLEGPTTRTKENWKGETEEIKGLAIRL